MLDSDNAGILLVDDEENILTILRRLLKKEGFQEVITALNAAQAIQFIQKTVHPFALIISDQHMPGMSGNELFKKAVEMTPDTRRIIMTGYSDAKAAAEAINMGAIHRYIKKPWENKALFETIKQELGIYHKTQGKHKLIRITKTQNACLYNFAKKTTEKNRQYQKEIHSKNETTKLLEKEIENLSILLEDEAAPWRMEAFLSKTNLLRPDAFLPAFNLINKKMINLLEQVSKEAALQPINQKPISDDSGDSVLMHSDEITYQIVDKIIASVCKLNENKLVDLGIQSAPDLNINGYVEVPSIIELAGIEGFLSQESLYEVKTVMSQPEKEMSLKSILQLLVGNQFLSRKDFNKILTKRNFIGIHLNDKVMAASLIKQNLVSEQNISKAFRIQACRFNDENRIVPLKLILVETRAIPEAALQDLDDPLNLSVEKSSTNGDTVVLPQGSLQQGVDLEISYDRLKAYLRLPQNLKTSLDSHSIIERLKQRGICHGVVEEKLISGFFKLSKDPSKRFVVAMGTEPVPGRDANVNYYFNPNYQQVGVVQPDGTIDFRERGDIPLVKKGESLARKTPLQVGRVGRDIYGEEIPVEDVKDVRFKAGQGTLLSKDGLEVFAAAEGQPKLEPLGTISVFKEFVINGDVGFETGHINFLGNVIVTGRVKGGFKVNCVDLTVNEIDDGVVDITGDLKVSSGIINARIKAGGTVQAKFINNSKIDSFGSISITREIMEAKIVTAGKCTNKTGQITASTISAKNGMELYRVGTKLAANSTLRIGMDDYNIQINSMFETFKTEINNQIALLRKKKQVFEEKNLALQKQIADISLEQEKQCVSLDRLKKESAALIGNPSKLAHVSKEIVSQKQEIDDIDTQTKEMFVRQDELITAIDKCDQDLNELQHQYYQKHLESEEMNEVLEFKTGNPTVKVNKEIVAGTILKAPGSSMVVKQSAGACTILETDSNDPDGKRIIIQTG